MLQQDAGNANRYAFSYSNGAGGWIITKRIKLIELGLMTIGSRELVQPGAADVARLTGYDARDHGGCLSVYENALGGRVAVTSYAPWRRLGSLCKRSQLTELADWLSFNKMPVRIDALLRNASHHQAAVLALRPTPVASRSEATQAPPATSHSRRT